MNKATWWIVIIVIVAAIAGAYIKFGGIKGERVDENQTEETTGDVTEVDEEMPGDNEPGGVENAPVGSDSGGEGTELPEGDVAKTVTVRYTATGFEPADVSIEVGDTVTWVNNSTGNMWPATAMHPTHTVYPGSDFKKCNTPEEKGIFDACRGIPPGESYTFTFTRVGNWKYHDHLNTQEFGSVTVK